MSNKRSVDGGKFIAVEIFFSSVSFIVLVSCHLGVCSTNFCFMVVVGTSFLFSLNVVNILVAVVDTGFVESIFAGKTCCSILLVATFGKIVDSISLSLFEYVVG